MSKLEIFKPGPVTSMEGVRLDVTPDMLRGIAQRYDPAKHEAPVIVGHPAHDAPAYAWVQGLAFDEGTQRLVADEHQVDAAFADMRREGRFKKLSARFYTPDSPNNPTPGEYYLRDIGFLGAMPPAVKGLRQASFASGADELVTVDVSFGELPSYAGNVVARVLRSIREWILADKGQEVADRVVPSYEIESLVAMATQAEMQEPQRVGGFAFAEGAQPTQEKSTMKTAAELQAELDAANARAAAAEQEAQRLRDASSQQAAAGRHAANLSFAEGLIQASRWPQDGKDQLVAVLDALQQPGANGATLSFGEGDGAPALHTAMRDVLSRLPAAVSFGEHATKGKAGAEASSDREIAERARAHKAKVEASGGSISFAEAVDAVNNGTAKE